MLKEIILDIFEQEKLLVLNNNMKYEKKFIWIKVFCANYRIPHGANILTYNNLFDIEQSTMDLMFCESVMAFNIVFKKLILY